MIKTKDLEKFAESLGDEVVDLNCNYMWLSARYYKSQFGDFRLSTTDYVHTAYGDSLPIEGSYVQLQIEVLADEGEEMQDIFKPYFKDPECFLITGTNLAKLIRDLCYKE